MGWNSIPPRIFGFIEKHKLNEFTCIFTFTCSFTFIKPLRQQNTERSLQGNTTAAVNFLDLWGLLLWLEDECIRYSTAAPLETEKYASQYLPRNSTAHFYLTHILDHFLIGPFSHSSCICHIWKGFQKPWLKLSLFESHFDDNEPYSGR